jgi:hypothetical protein
MSGRDDLRWDIERDRIFTRKRAWELLCGTARLREAGNIKAWACRTCEQMTGKPWALCGEREYETIIRKIGGKDE